MCLLSFRAIKESALLVRQPLGGGRSRGGSQRVLGREKKKKISKARKRGLIGLVHGKGNAHCRRVSEVRGRYTTPPRQFRRICRS